MNGYFESRKFDADLPLRAWMCDSPVNFRTHWQDSVEIYYCMDGFQLTQIGTSTVKLDSGSALVIPPGYLHGYSGGSLSLKSGFAIFTPAFIDNSSFRKIDEFKERKDYTEFISSAWYINNIIDRDTFEVLQELSSEIKLNQPYSQMASRALMNLLIAKTIRIWKTNRDNEHVIKLSDTHLRSNKGIEKIKDAIKYIEDNYSDKLTLTKAAAHLCVDKHHLCRLFKRITGNTFFEYVNLYRVEMAGKDLLSSNFSITEITFRNGFGNLNSFERIFKSYTGLTPSSYKNTLGH